MVQSNYLSSLSIMVFLQLCLPFILFSISSDQHPFHWLSGVNNNKQLLNLETGESGKNSEPQKVGETSPT